MFVAKLLGGNARDVRRRELLEHLARAIADVATARWQSTSASSSVSTRIAAFTTSIAPTAHQLDTLSVRSVFPPTIRGP
jgi:hypothetical protein